MSEAEIVLHRNRAVQLKPALERSERLPAGDTVVPGDGCADRSGAIGLDVLRVRSTRCGARRWSRAYLDNQLYVGFRQPLQYKESSTESGVTTKTSFEVEYAIYRWLLLNLQGETSKVRSFFRVRHAY
jgi:hypothetical protein